jgi:hypothetical protein
LAALSGCRDGPELGKVSGRVTYKGEPVSGAVVSFIPRDERKQSIGFTNEEGEYELQYTLRREGALIGRHRVSVRVYPDQGRRPVPVPEKYGPKSKVEFEVERGRNRFDIELSL